ncbi:MAG: LapA family protein [Calditrichaeota bacterium]|nr:LapA family protein [Calditrichota bacterium]
MTFKRILIWLIVFFVLILIVQNLDVIQLDVFFWSIQASLLLVILLPFLLGILVGWLFTSIYLRQRRQLKESKQKSSES